MTASDLLVSKNENTSVIRLNVDASKSLETMLEELLKEDKNLRVNYSKLASYIMLEFHKKNFDRLKPKLILAYQDKKRALKARIEGLSHDELEAAFKYLDKNKKPIEEAVIKND